MDCCSLNIAIVEDDEVLLDELSFQLKSEGHSVEKFTSAEQFYKFFPLVCCNVLLLDVSLPGDDGFTVCKHLRSFNSHIHIIFVTARADAAGKHSGYEYGADFYLTKPVDLEELCLMLKRISQKPGIKTPSAISVSRPIWRLLSNQWKIQSPCGKCVLLSNQEHQFLKHLMQTPQTIVSKNDLVDAIWGGHWLQLEKRVDVLVSRLRKKALHELGEPLPLTTARNVGYAFLGCAEIIQDDWGNPP